MPYILQLITENGEVIESSFIRPDNPNFLLKPWKKYEQGD